VIGDAPISALHGYVKVAIDLPHIYINVENDISSSWERNIKRPLLAGQIVPARRSAIGRNGEQAIEGDIALRRTQLRAARQDCVADVDVAGAAANIQDAADAIHRDIAYRCLDVEQHRWSIAGKGALRQGDGYIGSIAIGVQQAIAIGKRDIDRQYITGACARGRRSCRSVACSRRGLLLHRTGQRIDNGARRLNLHTDALKFLVGGSLIVHMDDSRCCHRRILGVWIDLDGDIADLITDAHLRDRSERYLGRILFIERLRAADNRQGANIATTRGAHGEEDDHRRSQHRDKHAYATAHQENRPDPSTPAPRRWRS